MRNRVKDTASAVPGTRVVPKIVIFDRQLFERKLQEPALRMQKETQACWRQVQFRQRQRGQAKGAGYLGELADSAVDVLRDYLEAIDRIVREVWHTQGNAITPEFLRGTLREIVCGAIDVRAASISAEINLLVRRGAAQHPTFPLRRLARVVRQLKSERTNRYEIEASELEYASARDARGTSDESAANKPAEQLVPVAAYPKKRGPKANMDRYRDVAEIVGQYGDNWKEQSNLEEIALKLDKVQVPPSPAWAKRKPVAKSWDRAVRSYRELVIKAIDYNLKKARESF